ncbi:MAG: amidohydrolase [candidate division Zixibacteria bacterium]|nr:amidohydrolase [candidate division Zixibacteria bacterium]
MSKCIQLTIVLISFVLSCSTGNKADLIITGGRVYTFDPANPQAEAVAVRDGKIVMVGSAEKASILLGKKTRLIQLNGEMVLPGLIDAHAHLLSLGRNLSELNLKETTSVPQIRQMVLDRQKQISQGGWLTGRGWDQNDWAEKNYPTWNDLQGTESNPVYLRRVDGHAAWVNRTALEVCRIDKNTADPPGGRILRDAAGEPTGILIDNAVDLVSLKIPQPSVEDKTSWLMKAMAECNRYGLTGLHDMGIDSANLEIYRTLEKEGKLTLRIYAVLSDEDTLFLKKYLQGGAGQDSSSDLQVKAMKLYADGALGSRGALLLSPYSDDPKNSGLPVRTREYLARFAGLAVENGFQVCTHAIGDAGNRAILDIFEDVLKDKLSEDLRLRIEHAQVLAPSDIPRFAKLGVIASMQPTHATSDMYWAEERIGPERIKGAYAWRKLLNQDARIAFGSDFPVEGTDPLWGVYAAVTRQDHEGWPEGGWHPEEKLSVEEALGCFTIEAAYAGFAEDRQGSIQAGKLADFTILNEDIFTIPPTGILNAEVAYTIIGGNIVYSQSKE